jgi:hypothetical protein
MDLSGLLRQMIQQQAQAGAPPYVPQQMPHIPGISPGAPTSTGPSQYATPSALPPYQSQFAPRARAQYVTQNLVGGLNNAVQQYNQRRWDKKSAEAQKDILDSLYERAGMTPPGGNIQPQTAQVGGGAATGTPSTPAGGGVGASRMAGQMPAMQAQGPPTVLQQLQQAYNQEQDPKQKERLAKTIQQRQKWEEQRAGRIAQAVSKAQTDPMSPEYNGAMKAYGIFQAQLTAQNEAQQKAAEIQAAQAQAKAREMQAIGETAKAAAEQQKLTTLTPYQQAYIGVLRNRDANVDLRNRAWYQVGVQRNLISDRNNARLYNAYIQRANAGDKDAQELVNMINTANKENEGYQRAINDAQQNVAKETKNLQDAKGKVGLGYLFSRDDIKAIRDRINTYNNQAKALQDKINANQKRVDDLKRQQDLAAMSMGQRAQAPLQLLPLPDLPPMPNYDALPDLPGAGGDTNLTAPSLTAPSGEAGDGSVDKPIDMRQ